MSMGPILAAYGLLHRVAVLAPEYVGRQKKSVRLRPIFQAEKILKDLLDGETKFFSLPRHKIPTVSLSMWRLFKEFLLFARQEKKWWLIPLIVLLLVLGAILIFASSSGIAWALYPFF